MRIAYSETFLREYETLPEELKDAVDRKLERLSENLRHPSLQAKKMRGAVFIWELRVTRGYRITFEIREDVYYLRRVGTHDILRRP